MKLFGRWIGRARRIGQLEAQLASTRELASMYAGQVENLTHAFAHRGVELDEVADLVRKAHGTMNLNGGRRPAQAHLNRALRILAGVE